MLGIAILGGLLVMMFETFHSLFDQAGRSMTVPFSTQRRGEPRTNRAVSLARQCGLDQFHRTFRIGDFDD
jgi:hypothetical protein